MHRRRTQVAAGLVVVVLGGLGVTAALAGPHKAEVGMFISTEDGEPDKSQLYAYTADTPQDAIEGNGQLWVWRSDSAGDGDPSSDDIAKGRTDTERSLHSAERRRQRRCGHARGGRPVKGGVRLHAARGHCPEQDRGDDIVNPDNIDTSPGKVVITEDRNSENRPPSVKGGFGRVLVYDIEDEAITPIARVATPSSLLPGTWKARVS